jgi:glycerol-1-phosphate dehydrogenase [NAD(P)+]
LNSIHRIDLPRVVLLGRGVLDSLGEVSLEHGVERPLIVTGHTTIGIAGSKAEDNLRAVGLEPQVELCENADLETVNRISRISESIGADTIIGVGGGRTIDVAKLSAGRSPSGSCAGGLPDHL